jgi:hypothetical protein
VVDFLEWVWYASIEVKVLLKTTPTACGARVKIEFRSHSVKGMGFVLLAGRTWQRGFNLHNREGRMWN